MLYFDVADIQLAHAGLIARGVMFKSEPHVVAKLPDREVWLADFGDGEGNTLALMSEVKIEPVSP